MRTRVLLALFTLLTISITAASAQVSIRSGHAQPMRRTTIRLDIQVKQFQGSATVMLYEKIGGTAWKGVIVGDIMPDGRLMRPMTVRIPDHKKQAVLAVKINGAGWSNKLHRFYVKDGDVVTIKAQDKRDETLHIQTSSSLNLTHNKFKKLTAQSTAWFNLCSHKLDSLGRISTKSEKEYRSVQKHYHEWKIKEEAAYLDMKRQQLKALQQISFDDCWVDLLTEASEMLKSGYDKDFCALLEETLKTVPQKERNKSWYINQESLLTPAKECKTGDVVEAELEDIKGATYRLSQFRGKYVLLYFWSDGLMLCEEALQEMKQLSAELADNVVFVAVTDDYNDTNWKVATDRMSGYLNKYNLRDRKGLGGLWKQNRLSSLPTFILLSPEGKKLDLFTGYTDGVILDYLKPYLQVKLKATLTVINKSREPELQLTACMPHGRYFQQMVKDTLKVTDKASLSLPIDHLGMVTLEGRNKASQMVLPVERGQHYTLEFDGQRFTLVGESAAQQLYAKLYPEFDAKIHARRFMDYEKASQLLYAVDRERKAMQDKVQQSFKKKKISNDMYVFIQSDIECYWRTVLGAVALNHSQPTVTEEAQKMWKQTSESVDPNDKRFIGSHSFYDFLEMQANSLMLGDLQGMESLSAGARAKAYMDQFRWFLKGEHLEHLFAWILYKNLPEGKTEKEILTLFQEFKNQYPESRFLPVLKSMIGQ